MSKLEFFNKFVFQMFFFRLAKDCHLGDKESYVSYWIMGGIIPFTGWNNNYRYIFKNPFIFRITKNKKI